MMQVPFEVAVELEPDSDILYCTAAVCMYTDLLS